MIQKIGLVILIAILSQCKSMYGPSSDEGESQNQVNPVYYPISITPTRIFNNVFEDPSVNSQFFIVLDGNYDPTQKVYIHLVVVSPPQLSLSATDAVLSTNTVAEKTAEFNFKINTDLNFNSEPIKIDIYANGYYQFSVVGNTKYQDKLIFITANDYNGNLGGLMGADQICNNNAKTQGYKGYFKAMLGLVGYRDPVSPDSWIFQIKNYYRNINYDELFNTIGGSLIPTTFSNRLINSSVLIWSGFKDNFTPQNDVNTNCNNWFSQTNTALIGDASQDFPSFLNMDMKACTDNRKLVCIQQ